MSTKKPIEYSTNRNNEYGLCAVTKINTLFIETYYKEKTHIQIIQPSKHKLTSL